MGHEGDSIANITVNKDIGVHEFAKDLTIGEDIFFGKGTILRGTLLWSDHGLEGAIRTGDHRNDSRWDGLGFRIPTMHF